MNMTSGHLILVNELDEPVGTMEKMEAHRKGLLHRAFSVFIFNGRGEMLLQQRADNKYHSAGLWTNACCSHPLPGEDTSVAAVRRLQEELGFVTPLEKVFEFTYKSHFDNGLTEFEYDHVYAGIYDKLLVPDRHEVKDFCYMKLADISASLKSHPHKYSAWFNHAFPTVRDWAIKKFGTSVAELN